MTFLTFVKCWKIVIFDISDKHGIQDQALTTKSKWVSKDSEYCQTPVFGLGLGVDFTFTWDNNKEKKNKNNKNPHLNFLKGTVLGNKEQGVGIKDNGKSQRIRDKTKVEFDTEDQVLS